jgi:hypothetical protein
LIVTEAVDVAPPTVWSAVSTTAPPFGSGLSVQDQLPGGFGTSVVAAVVEVVAVQLAPPGAAETDTVLPLSADPLTVTESLPENALAIGASISTGLGVPAAGVGDTALLPGFDPDGVDGSSADAGLTPKNPMESNAIAHTPVKTAILVVANRRSSRVPRPRNAREATLGYERCTVTPI